MLSISHIISNPIFLKLIGCGVFLYILNIVHFACVTVAGFIAMELRDKGYLPPYRQLTKDDLGINTMPLKYCYLLQRLHQSEEILYGIGLFILLDQRAKIIIILIYLSLYIFYLVYVNILLHISINFRFVNWLYHVLLIFLLYKVNMFVAIILLIKFIFLGISLFMNWWYFTKKNNCKKKNK